MLDTGYSIPAKLAAPRLFFPAVWTDFTPFLPPRRSRPCYSGSARHRASGIINGNRKLQAGTGYKEVHNDEPT